MQSSVSENLSQRMQHQGNARLQLHQFTSRSVICLTMFSALARCMKVWRQAHTSSLTPIWHLETGSQKVTNKRYLLKVWTKKTQTKTRKQWVNPGGSQWIGYPACAGAAPGPGENLGISRDGPGGSRLWTIKVVKVIKAWWRWHGKWSPCIKL